MASNTPYHHLGRESGGDQMEPHDDQVSILSTSPSRDRNSHDHSEFFSSILQDSYYPSNQSPYHLNDHSPPATFSNPPIASHALDSDLSGTRTSRRSIIPRKPVAAPSKHPDGNVIELRSLMVEDPKSPPTPHATKLKEWKPMLLRKRFAAILVLACWLLVVLLEIFRLLGTRGQGFSTSNYSVVQLIRYFPTIIIICLGFGWKSLVWELKLITPYSVMSNRPTSSGIWLDYIDTVELVAVWKAARNRHWAMFLGLATGLLCGILVPLANSLTFIGLNSPVTQDVRTNLTSQFSFGGVLATENSTLTLPLDYRGGQPYAAVASSRMANGKNSPWTVDSYAFDSVDITSCGRKNASVVVNVQAVNAAFDCQKIGYTLQNATYSANPHIKANDADLLAARCRPNLGQKIISLEEFTELGWLNVTDCSNDGTDFRMLATVMDVSYKPGAGIIGVITSSSQTGLLCKPHYFQQQAQIQVNGSTGDILSFTILDKEPKPLDVGAGLPAIVTYLNNPLDEKSRKAHLPSGDVTYSYLSDSLSSTFKNVTDYAAQYDNRDVFFDQLFSTDRKPSQYISDPDLLQSEVTELSNMILAQVMNSFTRSSTSVPTGASVTLYERRLLVRVSSLRAMQAILAFLGLMSVLFCTFLRPKSVLTENPGNIAAISVILSHSDESVERQFQRKADIDDGRRWMLSRSQEDGPMLEHEEIATGVLQESDSFINQPVLAPEITNTTHTHDFKPLPFRWIARFLLLLFVSLTITALAVLLSISSSTGGFVAQTASVSTAWSTVPTVILVLLGYCLSSVHGVLEAFTPYLTLLGSSGSSTLRSSTHGSVFLMPIKALLRFGSLVLATSSVIALFFPAIKVLAAGLYVPDSSIKSSPIQVTLTPSLTENFEAMYDMFPSAFPIGEEKEATAALELMVKRASQAAEWTSIPQFGFPHRGGALDNLIFSDFSNITFPDAKIDSPDSHITVKIPAIAINVSCTSVGPEEFDVYVLDSSTSKNWMFSFNMRCATKTCNETVGLGNQISWSKSNFTTSNDLQYKGDASVVGFGQRDSLKLYDTEYKVRLGNFPSINSSFTNQTSLFGLKEAKLQPGQFNITSFPSMIAAQCRKSIWETEVSVVLRKPTKSTLDGTITLPWSIVDFNTSTIQYKRQYAPATPLWAYPKKTRPNQYNVDVDSFLKSDSLWPSTSMATNIFEQLAAWQQFQGGNLTALLDHRQLARALEATWTAYLVEMVTELRPWIALNATGVAKLPRVVDGTLYTPLTRMKQHKPTTIAVCVLLGLMLFALLFIFFKFPRESLMANPPTSIAAQMSLLAGSRLVRGLREEKVRSVSGTDVWRRKFRLGWWPVNDGSGWRWGIDFVDDAAHDERR